LLPGSVCEVDPEVPGAGIKTAVAFSPEG